MDGSPRINGQRAVFASLRTEGQAPRTPQCVFSTFEDHLVVLQVQSLQVRSWGLIAAPRPPPRTTPEKRSCSSLFFHDQQLAVVQSQKRAEEHGQRGVAVDLELDLASGL